MKNRYTRLSAFTLTLALGLGSTGIGAQPPENRGKPDHAGKHAQHPGKQDRDRDDYYRDEDYREDRYRDDRYRDERYPDDRYDARDDRNISIEEAVIREIFRDERSYVQADSTLPPGIRKNLARGKPLPPGIAKKFDGRVQSRLPDYPGYDWRQVGTDAVLIHATTGIVEAIFDNVVQ